MPICTLQSPEVQYSTNRNRKISFIGSNTTCFNLFVQPELEHHKRKKKNEDTRFIFTCMIKFISVCLALLFTRSLGSQQ